MPIFLSGMGRLGARCQANKYGSVVRTIVLVLVLVLSFIFCSGSGLTQNPEDLIQKRLQHTAIPNHIEGK